VNAYCPGIVDTHMWDDISEFMGVQRDDALSGFGDLIALGRLQTPEDVAGFVSFIVSEDGSYITGQSVNVDGGILYQ
jgi:meso-butanediol dehydrogenase/(S,S)-butanediol dehydrogenase/diacetyl reductase